MKTLRYYKNNHTPCSLIKRGTKNKMSMEILSGKNCFLFLSNHTHGTHTHLDIISHRIKNLYNLSSYFTNKYECLKQRMHETQEYNTGHALKTYKK